MFAPIARVPPIVNPVKVPSEVMAGCAAVVTVAAVPEAFPVTLPTRGPKNPEAVTLAALTMFPLAPVAVNAAFVIPDAPVKVAPARGA